jgi:membrane-associated phospholipid phosphatase
VQAHRAAPVIVGGAQTRLCQFDGKLSPVSDVFGRSHPLLSLINGWARHSAWLHGPAIAYAVWAGPLVLGLLLVAGWLFARRAGVASVAAAFWAAAGSVVALGVNQPLAHLVGEPRPYLHVRTVDLLVPRTHDFSFPSDHAVLGGAAAAGLWFVDRRLAAVAGLAGLLLAADRVYVGAHYGHDVVAGLLVGALVVGIGYLGVRKVLQRAVIAVAASWLRPLVLSRGTPLALPHRGASSSGA